MLLDAFVPQDEGISSWYLCPDGPQTSAEPAAKDVPPTGESHEGLVLPRESLGPGAAA